MGVMFLSAATALCTSTTILVIVEEMSILESLAIS